MSYVLDADVLIGALDANDAHHKQSRRLLTGWHARQDPLLISLPNLSEVLVAPAAEAARLRAARAAIAALGVGSHQPNEAIAVDAARIRGRHPVSLPDAYLLATARHLDAQVASYDAKVLRAAKVEAIATAGT